MTVKEARTFAQIVQQRLSNDILVGLLQPGSKLKLNEISTAYSTGMSPLREALANLVGKGLVLQEGQRGFRVAPANLDDFRDIVKMRTQMEIMALRAAIIEGDVSWEAGILQAHHVFRRHERVQETLIDEHWEELHQAFHLSLIRACGSPRLLAYCSGLLAQFDRYRRLAVLSCGYHARLRSLDKQIADAALGRDAETASTLLTQHITESGALVVEMLFEHKVKTENNDPPAFGTTLA